MSITISRSPKTATWKSTTPNNLGPGVYTPAQKKPVENFKERELFNSNEVPGPGAYCQPSKIKREAYDGRSGNFKSLVPRFAPNCPGANVYNYPSCYSNPGPGNYRAGGKAEDENGKKVRQIRRKIRHYSEARPEYNTTPSIPGRRQAKKGYTGRGGDTIGPNHYEPSLSQISKRPKGVSFSRLADYKEKANKSKAVNQTLPGPGQYSFNLSTQQNFNVKGNSSFIAPDVIPNQKVNQPNNQPGPGSYNVSMQQRAATAQLEDIVKIPFMSGQEGRDGWQKDRDAPFTAPFHSQVPGPGYYQKRERTKEVRAKIFALLDGNVYTFHGIVAVKMPFNSSTTREDTAKVQEYPGPGTYIDINNPIHSSVSKGILRFATDRVIMEAQGLTSGPFGTTEKRFKNSCFSGKDINPGPGQYTEDEQKKDELERVYEKIAKPRTSSKSSMFCSKTERFRNTFNGDPFIHVVGKNQDSLKPSTAMPMQDTSTAQNQQTKRLPPSYAEEKLMKPAFNSAAPRWRTHRIVHTASPGPGAYSVVGAMTVSRHGPRSANMKKRTQSRTDSRADYYRPKTGTNNKLGPGYYAVECSMIKRSFNMSLDNSFAYL